MPSLRKSIRRLVNPKEYEYKTPDDLLYLSSEAILLDIDPSKVDPDILDKNLKKKLSDDQLNALRKLLAIRRTSKSFAKGPKRDKYVAETKSISWNELNPNSVFNREINKVISEAKHDAAFEKNIRDRLTALKSSPHKNEFIINMEKRLDKLKEPISKTPRRGGRKGGRKTRKLR